ncbi:hypothetical protein EON65_42825 [archaeon]|nr:MAG: hypothetical protein EON65_42825 [archaeon]
MPIKLAEQGSLLSSSKFLEVDVESLESSLEGKHRSRRKRASRRVGHWFRFIFGMCCHETATMQRLD